MPRYFFNVQDGVEYPDLQGSELADLNAARVEAVRFAGTLLNDTAHRFWEGEAWNMQVADEHGITVFILSFTAEQMPAAKRVPFVSDRARLTPKAAPS